MTTNWLDPRSSISKHFKVVEALYLPKWQCFHIPTDVEKQEILAFAQKMELIREFLKLPIDIHCWLRPTALNNPSSPHHGQDYNALVGGATKSAHRLGRAADWDCGESCDVTRAKLAHLLETYGVRMEKTPGTNWVHIDDMPVPAGGRRYFTP